jgi:metal-responsive CopG/Arc/MetJ family transcriptional regulator
MGAHTVGVEISMSSKLLAEWDAHLETIGERNRSAWTRQAILARIREEREYITEG